MQHHDYWPEVLTKVTTPHDVLYDFAESLNESHHPISADIEVVRGQQSTTCLLYVFPDIEGEPWPKKAIVSVDYEVECWPCEVVLLNRNGRKQVFSEGDMIAQLKEYTHSEKIKVLLSGLARLVEVEQVE